MALNGKHTIFGIVAEGLEVLDKLNRIYVDNNNRPLVNIRIYHTNVLEDPFPDFIGLREPSKSPDLQVNV
jgi:peptidyl-prolyl cis-trans isomerase-like 4